MRINVNFGKSSSISFQKKDTSKGDYNVPPGKSLELCDSCDLSPNSNNAAPEKDDIVPKKRNHSFIK